VQCSNSAVLSDAPVAAATDCNRCPPPDNHGDLEDETQEAVGEAGLAADASLPATARPLKIYVQQRCRGKAAPPLEDPSSPVQTPAVSPHGCYFNEVTKPTNQLLPRPTILKRRVKTSQSKTVPRHSRRVAGTGPCSPGPVTNEAQDRL
jgi:hypothetical protein